MGSQITCILYHDGTALSRLKCAGFDRLCVGDLTSSLYLSGDHLDFLRFL